MLRLLVIALLLATYAVLVATTPSHKDLPLRYNFLKDSESKVAALVPWRCFATNEYSNCSGTILTKEHVMVRDECFAEGGPIYVHTGTQQAGSADQVVQASVLNATGTPAGIVVLKLCKKLSLNAKVSCISV